MIELTETWRAIPGYEGRYEVSDRGRVRSLDHVVLRSDGRKRRCPGKILSAHSVNAYGHLATKLGADRSALVHVLVAEAFLGPAPDGKEVRHLNGNPKDNRAENLSYGTRSENQRDHYDYGRRHAWGKLTAADVRAIRARLANGDKPKNIAPDFNISISQISAIKTKRSFSYID